MTEEQQKKRAEERQRKRKELLAEIWKGDDEGWAEMQKQVEVEIKEYLAKTPERAETEEIKKILRKLSGGKKP